MDKEVVIKVVKLKEIDSVSEMVAEILEEAFEKGKEGKKEEEESKEPNKASASDKHVGKLSPDNWTPILRHMSNRTGIPMEHIVRFIKYCAIVSSDLVFDALFKELAIMFDESFDDHISNSKEIWSFDRATKRLYKVDKSKIKDYRNFAAFRSIGLAKVALDILRDCLEDMYGKGE